MLSTADTITARELVYDIIPKLKATKNLVANTLCATIQQASNDEERNRQTLLQQEFELEITMIQMNLDPC